MFSKIRSERFIFVFLLVSSCTQAFSPINVKSQFGGHSTTKFPNALKKSTQTRMALESMDTQALSQVFQATSNLIAEETTYSKASYYTTLGLYVISFPGLYSLVKRSVKASNVQKTYEVAGPAASEKSMKQIAGEIVAYFNAQNYQITDATDVISFKGVASKSSSQAFFLTFCTAIGLGSLALVLSIQFQNIGGNFFYMCFLAPYAGLYYWKNADREETAQVKLEISDDEKKVDVIVQAGKEEVERFARTMKYQEKGMVYVKGIFESEEM